MTLNDVKKFTKSITPYLNDSLEIRLLGGEPLLNPEIIEIIKHLIPYSKNPIYLFTNGTLKSMNDLLLRTFNSEIDEYYVFEEKRKTNNKVDLLICPSKIHDGWVDRHIPVTIAPIDFNEFYDLDYETLVDNCSIPYTCGLGVSSNGFYPCNFSITIDYVFNLKSGIKHYPSKQELHNAKLKYCKYCVKFYNDNLKRTDDINLTKTWKEALKRFNRQTS